MSDMRVGDIVRTKSIKALFSNEIASGEVTYKQRNGKCFLFLLLGQDSIQEPKLTSELFERLMNSMGWQKIPGQWEGD